MCGEGKMSNQLFGVDNSSGQKLEMVRLGDCEIGDVGTCKDGVFMITGKWGDVTFLGGYGYLDNNTKIHLISKKI